MQSLADLQQESAGLRAAIVTLGRELLSLKEEFAAHRDSVQAQQAQQAQPNGVPAAPPATSMVKGVLGECCPCFLLPLLPLAGCLAASLAGSHGCPELHAA